MVFYLLRVFDKYLSLCLHTRYLQRGGKVSLPRGPDHREDAGSSLHRHPRAGAQLLLPGGGSQRDVSRERRQGRHSVRPLPGRTSHRGCVRFVRLRRTCAVRSEETQGHPGQEIHRAVQKHSGGGPTGTAGWMSCPFILLLPIFEIWVCLSIFL